MDGNTPEKLHVLNPTGADMNVNGRNVRGGAVEWTIKDGIQYPGPTLMREVKDNDPRLALDGGPDGLAAYREIAAEASLFLAPEGVLLLEIGTGQSQSVHDILVGAGFFDITTERDLGGHDRMIVARRG